MNKFKVGQLITGTVEADTGYFVTTSDAVMKVVSIDETLIKVEVVAGAPGSEAADRIEHSYFVDSKHFVALAESDEAAEAGDWIIVKNKKHIERRCENGDVFQVVSERSVVSEGAVHVRFKEDGLGTLLKSEYKLLKPAAEAQSSFKPGDKVRSKNTGCEYVLDQRIPSLDNDGHGLAWRTTESSWTWIGEDQFELVPETEEPEFKIGDKVQAVGGLHLGETGTILAQKEASNGIGTVYQINFDGETWWKPARNLRKVVEPKFEVGDHVKGLPSAPYGITNVHMTRGEVVKVYGDMIDIKLIEHRSGDHQQEFTKLEAKYFEKIEKPRQEPKFQPGDRAKVVGNGSQGITHYLNKGDLVSVIRSRDTFNNGCDQLDVDAFYVQKGTEYQVIAAEDLEAVAETQPKFKSGDKVRSKSSSKVFVLTERAPQYDGGSCGIAWRYQDGFSDWIGENQVIAVEDPKPAAPEKVTQIEVTESEKAVLLKVLDQLRG